MKGCNGDSVAPCNVEPNAQPHERHHLDARVVPLFAQIGVMSSASLPFWPLPQHAIDIVDHWGEVFVAQLMTMCEVLFFLPFLISKNLHLVLM